MRIYIFICVCVFDEKMWKRDRCYFLMDESPCCWWITLAMNRRNIESRLCVKLKFEYYRNFGNSETGLIRRDAWVHQIIKD